MVHSAHIGDMYNIEVPFVIDYVNEMVCKTV